MDVMKVLIDHESEQDVENAGVNREKHVLYGIAGINIGIFAQMVHNATANMKKYLKGGAYLVTLRAIINKGTQWTFDLEFDDQKHPVQNATVQSLDITNVQFAGPNIFCPMTYINDGQIEVLRNTKKITFGMLGDIQKKAEQGGLSIYEYNWNKCTSVRIINKNTGSDGNKEEQVLGIDGENFFFKDFLKISTLKEEIEVIVDLDTIYKVGYGPVEERKAPPKPKSKAWAWILASVAAVGAAILFM